MINEQEFRKGFDTHIKQAYQNYLNPTPGLGGINPSIPSGSNNPITPQNDLGWFQKLRLGGAAALGGGVLKDNPKGSMEYFAGKLNNNPDAIAGINKAISTGGLSDLGPNSQQLLNKTAPTIDSRVKAETHNFGGFSPDKGFHSDISGGLGSVLKQYWPHILGGLGLAGGAYMLGRGGNSNAPAPQQNPNITINMPGADKIVAGRKPELLEKFTA